MLSKGDTQRFLSRNEAQATNLKKGLLGRHQNLYHQPKKELRYISSSSAFGLRASNPYAHNLWFRAIGSSLSGSLGLRRPDFTLERPLYFLTLSDRRTARVSDPDDDFDQPKPLTIAECVDLYRKAFWGKTFDMIGIVEPAMYVYCQSVFGEAPLFHYHLHALIWNVEEQKIKSFCKGFRKKSRTLIPYCTPALYKPVGPDDFLQMAWYISKYPRKQHQVFWQEPRIKSFKSAINGVNAVRQYFELGSLRLTELTIAQGEGLKVIEDAKAMVAVQKH